MSYTAVVITVSDKCSTGERQDTSGPAICEMLTQAGYSVIHTATVPDEVEQIRDSMLQACDALHANLVISTGGTGLSPPRCHPGSHPPGGGAGNPGHSAGHAVFQSGHYPPGHAFPGSSRHPRRLPCPQSSRFRKGRAGKPRCGTGYFGTRFEDAGGQRPLNSILFDIVERTSRICERPD